jgi:adenylosuccinate synthase
MRYTIVDLQFGSSGKGQLAGELALRREPDVVACAFTPNAGHCFVDQNNQKFIHCAIPNGIISPKIKTILIGPGAVVDVERVYKELGYYDIRPQVIIHPNAAILEKQHKEYEEATLGSIGSTMKGTSEALIAKMRRNPKTVRLASGLRGTPEFIINSDLYMDAWENAKVLQIEGTQGYSLSIHHGFWPYVTSRDTTVMQLLADCAIPSVDEVWGTLRTFPIRVNNRDGFSGPCYPDQEEISWESLGLQPELTTVTKLPRRIFTFSEIQVKNAIRQNAVTHLFVNFLNYLTPVKRLPFIDRVESLCPDGCQVAALGLGPNDVRFQ